MRHVINNVLFALQEFLADYSRTISAMYHLQLC
jgi:hypothetical protein